METVFSRGHDVRPQEEAFFDDVGDYCLEDHVRTAESRFRAARRLAVPLGPSLLPPKLRNAPAHRSAGTFSLWVSVYTTETTRRKTCLPTTMIQAVRPIDFCPDVFHMDDMMLKRSRFVSWMLTPFAAIRP